MNVISMVKPLYNTIIPKQIKQHIGKKPCECKQCGKSFVHPSNLQTHKRTCNGEKLNECNQCAEALNVSVVFKIVRGVILQGVLKIELVW